MMSSYVHFCDANELQRIDAAPEEHLKNLDKMATALLKLRQHFLDEIEARCPACNGSGRK